MDSYTSEDDSIKIKPHTLTSYIFEGDSKPPLTLTMEDGASTANSEDVNAALRFLGLPTVDRNGIYKKRAEALYLRDTHRGDNPEECYHWDKYSIATLYHWDDYPLGELVVFRTIAQNKRTYKGYDAIWKVVIKSSAR